MCHLIESGVINRAQELVGHFDIAAEGRDQLVVNRGVQSRENLAHFFLLLELLIKRDVCERYKTAVRIVETQFDTIDDESLIFIRTLGSLLARGHVR